MKVLQIKNYLWGKRIGKKFISGGKEAGNFTPSPKKNGNWKCTNDYIILK